MQIKSITATASVALYARVSTEDQAEKQTVQAQLDFLRKYCDLNQIPVAGEYVDDGISGTVPLDQRPEGRRLLDDSEAGRFGTALVYKLDRLGRSLTALLKAHDTLDRAGVAIKSATEPFDTSTSIGKFLFQLLASLAELERETIRDRTTLGRDRVAKTGKYTGGPIPFGYDVEEGHLVPSRRLVPGAGVTEAEFVRQLFGRIADGSTLYAETQRINALGIQPAKRYAGGKVVVSTGQWSPPRLAYVIHNPTYRGEATLDSRNGTVTRPTPALVDAATWERAQAALTRNRKLSTKNAKRFYLLRGLITCENCGLYYSGATWVDPKGRAAPWPHYMCNGRLAHIRPRPETRCTGRSVGALPVETAVWDGCAAFIRNPGEELAEAQRQLRERMARSTDDEDKRRALLVQIADKDGERERVLTLYRRGRITLEEADRELESIARETATLRELVESLRAQSALTQAAEAHLTSAAAALGRLRGELDEIEAMPDGPAKDLRKRPIIELLVARITISTGQGTPGKRKPAQVAIVYTYRPPEDQLVVSGTPSAGGSSGTSASPSSATSASPN